MSLAASTTAQNATEAQARPEPLGFSVSAEDVVLSPTPSQVDAKPPASLPCTHCGLSTVAPDNHAAGQPIFCCSGCQGAYALIQGWGLSEFYALRDQLTVTGAALAAGTTTQYQQFDTEEFLGESSPKITADGLACAELGVNGIHCAACTWLIENALQHQPGLRTARVKLSDHTLKIIYDPSTTKLSGIARFLDGLGYQLLPLDRTRENHLKQENRRLLVQIAIAGFLAANAMWIAVALYAGHFSGLAADQKYFFELIGMLLGTAAVCVPGRTFLKGAVAAVRARTPHMDLPIALALVVGAIVGCWNAIRGSGDVYFDGLTSLVFLLLIGRWIQFRQQHQAARSVELMLRVTPRHASLLGNDGSVATVLVDRLNKGDKIRVDAGECVAADGVIVQGDSLLNRSLLTGESVPVRVGPGDKIEAGTVNVGSPVVIAVSAVGKESRIGKIMQSVETAAAERTPIAQFADRISGIFVMVVMILASITFAIWLPHSLDRATNLSTALLIVACPCALGMATPLAIAVGIGRAARAQILVRDGAALQHLSKPGMLWIDKTGTLTEGRQHASLVWGSQDSLRLAAAIESQCQHPIAHAIVQAYSMKFRSASSLDSDIGKGHFDKDYQLELDLPQEVRVVTGGVQGRVDGREVVVGNASLLQALGLDIDTGLESQSNKLIAEGCTPIFIAVEGRVAGLLGLTDPLRAQAAELIQSARELGWTVGLLSGDLPEIAKRVASQVGIDLNLCYGGVTPEQKLAAIQQSRKEYSTVVMIGDGANDAAALAAADVGIAVRGGAEVSMHAAPVYLASNQLSNIARLLKGSRTTTRVIYTNFAVSLAYNLGAVSLAITGFISPLIAAIIMPLSSVTVLGLTFAIPSFQTSTKSSQVDR